MRAGTNSYVLFTLDKLIMKVVKQLQMLLNDDLASVRPCRAPRGACCRLQGAAPVAGKPVAKCVLLP